MQEAYRCLYCNIEMYDSAEWIDHINSETHRNMLLNRHRIQRDPGDEDSEPAYLWTARPANHYDE
jgi:hypothetical protein